MVVPMAGVVPVVVPMVVPMVRLGLLFDKWVLIRFLLFGAIFFHRQHPSASAALSVQAVWPTSEGPPPTIHKSMSAPRHPVPVSDHPVPVSDSAGYGGSRKHKQRYEFSEYSRCGFAELSPSVVMTGEQLFDSLKKVWVHSMLPRLR